MKKTWKMVLLLVIISLAQMFLFSVCKPEKIVQLPEVTTVAASYTDKTGIVTATVLSDGGTEILDQGVILGNTKISSQERGVGPFSVVLTNLSPNTFYSVKAYATNSVGTAVSLSSFTFKTNEEDWRVKTLEATEITSTSATLNAIVKATNSVTSVTFEYGATSSYGSTVVVATGVVVKNDTTVSVRLDQLSSAKTFHYRIKAVNSTETIYGFDKQFTTLIIPGFEISGCEIRDLETDANGNVYVVGIFGSTTSINKLDAFVARFNSNGELAWKKDIVTKDYDWPRGGIIVVGDVVYFHVNLNDFWGTGGGDIYVYAYNCQTGDLKWSNKIGSDNVGMSLTADKSGYIYSIVGSLIAVLDPTRGQIIKRYSPGSDAGFGEVAFMGDAIFAGGASDRDGHAIFTSNVSLIRKFDKDFVKIFDERGTELSSYSNVHGMITFPSDSLIIFGESYGDIMSQIPLKSSVVCYKLHKDGLSLDLVWKKVFSNGGCSISLKRNTTADDSFYIFSPDVGGLSSGSINGPVKMDLNGNIIWTASPKKNGNIAIYDGKIFLANGSSKLTIYN